MSHKKNDRADEIVDDVLDDEAELPAVVHKSARPAKQRTALGRETKVGLVVIVALLFIFSLVLIKRLIGPGTADATSDEIAAATDSTPSSTDGSETVAPPTDTKASSNTASFSNKSFDNKPIVMPAKIGKSPAENDAWSAGDNSFSKQTKASTSQSPAGNAYGAPSSPALTSTPGAATLSAYGHTNTVAETGRAVQAETKNFTESKNNSFTKNTNVVDKNNPLRSGSSGLTANVVAADDSNASPVFPRHDTTYTQPKSLTGPNDDEVRAPNSTRYNDLSQAAADSSVDTKQPHPAFSTQPRSIYGSELNDTAPSPASQSVADKSDSTPTREGSTSTGRSSNPFDSRGFNSTPSTSNNPAPTSAASNNFSANNIGAGDTALSKKDFARNESMTKNSTRLDNSTGYNAIVGSGKELTPADNVILQPTPEVSKSSIAAGRTNAFDRTAPSDSRNSTKTAGTARSTARDERAIQPAAPAYSTYQVKANDTYWTISERLYGTGSYFKALYEHNRLRSDGADRLSTGVELQTPDAATLERLYSELCPKVERAAATSSNVKRPIGADTGRKYLVEEGDTLLEIARRELGKPTRWAEIYQLNREQAGIDLDYLRPGTELILPADGRGSLR